MISKIDLENDLEIECKFCNSKIIYKIDNYNEYCECPVCKRIIKVGGDNNNKL